MDFLWESSTSTEIPLTSIFDDVDQRNGRQYFRIDSRRRLTSSLDQQRKEIFSNSGS